MQNQFSRSDPRDGRRALVLIISVVLLGTSAICHWNFGEDGWARFVISSTGRVGLVMGALWLAWPSLKRPAAWLPPGFAVGGVILIAVVAVQPRLVFVMVPAFGVLMTVASIARKFR